MYGGSAGDVLELVARNEPGDWYELGNRAWIAAFLVDNAPGDLEVAKSILEPR